MRFSANSNVSARRLRLLLVLLAVVALIAAACGNDDDSSGEKSALGDGSLGVVTVEAGESIQIRSLNSLTDDEPPEPAPNQQGVELAIAHFGDIKGFSVDLGTGLDDMCNADGGRAGAQAIVADENVVGIIGTSCSGAAVAAAPIVTDAGMVMISPSNTSPTLTSDFEGNAGENYNVGYYRTAHNDLVQGAAMAHFVYDELGLRNVAALHDGDAYTLGLTTAFRNAFEELGGSVTGFVGVNKEDTDLVPALTELAAGSPEALFFPVFLPIGDFVLQQSTTVPGLEDVVLLTADGLLDEGFLGQALSVGTYLSGPDIRFGTNYNQGTGRTAAELEGAFRETYGQLPVSGFWGHAYDATTLLLDAIDAASYVEDGNLRIDRAGVREYLDNVRNYSGITGTLSCDDFGDCGSQRITVIRHIDSSDIETSEENVVFSYAATE